jgi:hypothetical protein
MQNFTDGELYGIVALAWSWGSRGSSMRRRDFIKVIDGPVIARPLYAWARIGAASSVGSVATTKDQEKAS